MSNYDYGYFGGSAGTPVPADYSKKGQVYLATHDDAGNKLNKTLRAHISFSWGGRDIEDFNLLVVSDGDSYERSMYAPFEDLTTQYDLLDGQYYWRTHLSPYELTLNLATDGVTEKMLQDFRNWFRPGVERELILSEFPYRAIQARIAETPTYSFLPFRDVITKTIGGETYTTSSTLWKGSVVLQFIMDEPIWYSLASVFQGTLDSDKLKAMVDDGIPHSSMFKVSCFLPNNYIAEYSSADGEHTVAISNEINIPKEIQASTNANIHPLYLYYCGTAAEKPIISFSFNANQFNENGYCTAIGNSYIATKEDEKYSILKIGENEFHFTTPGLLSAYNQAVSILRNDFKEGESILDLKKAFRDTLSNFYVRMWCTSICELSMSTYGVGLGICDANSALTSNFRDNFIACLKAMFVQEQDNTSEEQDNTPEEQQPVVFKCACTFDSSTGQSIMALQIYTLDLTAEQNAFVTNGVATLPLTSENGIPVPVLIKENSGDMARSKYLLLEGRNLPNEEEQITENECLQVTANCNLYDFKINYKYRYL